MFHCCQTGNDEFQDRVLVLKDELLIAKDELTANKEIVRVLRRQLDFVTKEKEALYVFLPTVYAWLQFLSFLFHAEQETGGRIDGSGENADGDFA